MITAVFIIGLWIFANVLLLAIALVRAKEETKSKDKEAGEEPPREGDKETNK